MSKDDKNSLIELLKPLKRKITYKNMLFNIGWFTGISIGISIIFMIIAHFLPIEFYRIVPIFLIVISILCGIVYAFIKKPSLNQTANVADSFGLEERVITALNNQSNPSTIAELQRKNAITSLRKKLPNILSKYRVWPFSKRQISIYIVFLMALGITFFIPNQMDTLIAEERLYEETIAEIEEEVAEQQDEIENNESLEAQVKEELLSMLDELKDNLQERTNPEEQLQELEEFKKELYEKQNEIETAMNSISTMNQILEQNQQLQNLANLENEEQLNEELENIEKELESITDEQKEELLNALEQITQNYQQIAQNLNSEQISQLAQNFQNAVNSLQNGENTELLNSLSSALTQALQQNTNAQQANSQLANTIASIQQIQGSCNSGTCSNSSPNSNSNSSNGNNSSSGNNSNSSSSSSSGSGSGSGSNSGNGNGSGSGSGSGSSSASGIGSGAGLGSGSHVINVPTDRIDSEGITDTVNGNIGDGNYEVTEGSLGQAMPSITLPYEEVYAEYQERAFNSIDRNQIPEEYQDIIKEYFGSIEP